MLHEQDLVQASPRAGRSVLVDLDRLPHAQLLVVHHVAMHHEDPGVVEETRADHSVAALRRPRHDRTFSWLIVRIRHRDNFIKV